MHRNKPKSSRNTKLDYRLKASKINDYRIFVVYVSWEITNFLIGCLYRGEYRNRITIYGTECMFIYNMLHNFHSFSILIST